MSDKTVKLSEEAHMKASAAACMLRENLRDLISRIVMESIDLKKLAANTQEKNDFPRTQARGKQSS